MSDVKCCCQEEEDGYEEEDSDEDDGDTARQEETSPDHSKHNKTDWRQSVVKDLTQQCARSPVISRSDSLDQVLTGDQGRGELSLQEISHIRRVLARAELEHTVSSDLRYDLDNGRVCGLCHVTRFGVISRSTQCQLCSVVTCSRCCDTVTRLDTETLYNIDDIPPHLLAPATQDSAHNDITASRHNCAGSAPNTPPTARRISDDDDDDDCEDRFMSLPLHPPAVTSRSALPRRWSMVGGGRPENTVVCLQCKNMIKQVITTIKRRKFQVLASIICVQFAAIIISTQDICLNIIMNINITHLTPVTSVLHSL